MKSYTVCGMGIASLLLSSFFALPIASANNMEPSSVLVDDEVEEVSGKLKSVVGIGGESTGFQVGDVEVDFATNDLSDKAVKLIDSQVVVKGTYKTVTGVEGGDRKVLVAQSLKRK